MSGAKQHTHENVHDEIPAGDVAAEEERRDHHDGGGIDQLLVLLHPLLLGVPRPGRLHELDFDVGDEVFRLGEGVQEKMGKLKGWARRGGERSAAARGSKGRKTRQEGLEPPTGGFGDRCSTN